MRHLFVMDPLSTVNPDKDTTWSFLEEAQARGHESLVCGLADLRAEGSHGVARAQRVTLARPSFSVANASDVSFDDVDVIWMRKDPPVDDLYLFACMLLDRATPAKTLVLNDPRGLRVVHEKLWALGYDDVTPRQLVSSKADALVEFVKREGRGVLKPLHAMGGMGVFAFAADDKNLRSAADLLTQESKRPAVAQQYLPEVRTGDKRVLLVDGVPVGAVLRVPREDDVRSNMHVGGSAVKASVDDDDRKIAARIGPELVRLGQFFVGIDVIGGKLTEVNVTSPTGAQEIDRLDGRTGKDRISAIVMDAVERKVG
jgi:glutathione synthase